MQAINSGDRATASALAHQVLAVDSGNQDAEDLLATPAAGTGELRRLTILFADVVDSTALSTRIEPEIYRTVIGRYRQQVNDIVNRYEGHVFSTKGDGLLAVFGHPKAHENDVRRAVQAGLDITREVDRLSTQVRSRFGFEISVRAGIHRGLVYLDVEQDDVYGLGANLASRVSGLAPPGCVVGLRHDRAIGAGLLRPRSEDGATGQGNRRARRALSSRAVNASTGRAYRSGRLSAATVNWSICKPAGQWPRADH